MAKKIVLTDNSGNKCYPVTRDECVKCGDRTLPEKFSELDQQLGILREGTFQVDEIILKGKEFRGFDLDINIEQVVQESGAIQGYDENDEFIQGLYFTNGNIKVTLPDNFYYLKVKYGKMRVTKGCKFAFSNSNLLSSLKQLKGEFEVINKVLWCNSAIANPYIQELYLSGSFNGKDISQCGAYISQCGYAPESNQAFIIIKDENDESIISYYMTSKNFGYTKTTQNGVTIEMVHSISKSPNNWPASVEKGSGLLTDSCFDKSYSPYIQGKSNNEQLQVNTLKITALELKSQSIEQNLDEINDAVFVEKEQEIVLTDLSEDGGGRISDVGTSLIEFEYSGDGNKTMYYKNSTENILELKITGTSNPYVDVIPLFGFSDTEPIIGQTVVYGAVKSSNRGEIVNKRVSLSPNQYFILNGYANRTEVAIIVREPKEPSSSDTEKVDKIYNAVFETPIVDVSTKNPGTKIENSQIVSGGYSSKYFQNDSENSIKLQIKGKANP